MKTTLLKATFFGVGLIVASASLCSGGVSFIGSLGTPYSENFDTLASSGTSSTMPAGWSFLETGTSANTVYTAGTGSGNAGDTYSFGATGSSERALGGLQSGNVIPLFGLAILNSAGSTISGLVITYTGEQWRLGAAGRVDRLDFQYSTDATSLSSGTWTDFNALDFTAPTTSGTLGALNGNAALNQTTISSTISGLSWANGSTIWLRWSDLNATGADDGLGIDNFSLTAVPEPVNVAMAVFGVVVVGASGIRRLFKKSKVISV